MKLSEAMQEGVVRLHVIFEDGSEIQYISTHNRELLESLGFPNIKFLDLDTGEQIPKRHLTKIKKFKVGEITKSYTNELDTLAEVGAKHEFKH